MLLYLIRHGDPDYATDSLTELGKMQAAALPCRFSEPFSHIYSSPMRRAIETADPLCRSAHLPCEVLPWLREIGEEGYTHYPDGNRKFVITLPPEAFRGERNASLDYTHAFEASGLDDTQMHQYCQQILSESDQFFRDHGYTRQGALYSALHENDERIALFTHNGVARVWLSQLLHIPLHIMFSSFTMTHTGVTVIQMRSKGEGIAPVCLCFSDMSHLLKENLPYVHRGKTLL